MLFVVKPFQSLFDGKVAHEDSIYVTPTGLHKFSGVYIIFRLNQPFRCSLFHVVIIPDNYT